MVMNQTRKVKRSTMIKLGKDSLKKISTCLLCLISFYLLCVTLINSKVLSNDFFWLAASGREIVRNGGIPEFNPFTIRDDIPIRFQQWGWDVYCWFLYQHGVTAIVISNTVIGLLAFALLFLLLRTRQINRSISFFISSFALWLVKGYMISVRPECITIVLLLAQVYVTEKFIRTKKQRWIWQLPILMVIEMNLHFSMWFMHYCLLIPYMLPFGFGKLYPTQKPELKLKEFWPALVAMTAMLFVNPYGVNALPYPFEPLLNGTFKICAIGEMKPLFFSPSHFLKVFILLQPFMYGVWRKYYSAASIYICAGLFLMMATSIRSTLLVPVLVYYAIGDLQGHMTLQEHFSKYKLDAEKVKIVKQRAEDYVDALNYFLIAVTFVFGTFICRFVPAMLGAFKLLGDMDCYELSSDIDNMESARDIAVYLDEVEPDKNVHILNYIDSGGLLTLKGFNNIYMDIRVEVYNVPETSVFSDRSILEEHASLYYVVKYEGDTDEKTAERLESAVAKAYSYDEIKSLLEAYDAKYIVTMANNQPLNSTDYIAPLEFNLTNYLESGQTDYEQVHFKEYEDPSEETYLLYKRVTPFQNGGNAS